MATVRDLIDNSAITLTQIGVLIICVLMNMLDGMDVMVISYSGPTIQSEWGIDSQTLGIVFSLALLGMALGAAFLSSKADVMGRRNMIIICILVMGGGVLLTSQAENLWQLGLLRFISGLGIGAMLASTVTLASEYAPDRQRNLFVGIVLAGYPVGATLSGLVAAEVIPVYGWRTMFIGAGVATLITLPLAIFLLVESWDWLLKKQPPNALDRLNLILRKMGHADLAGLPEMTHEAKTKPGVGSLFRHGRADSTYKLWIAFFMGFATLYFLTTWIPNLARNTGLSLELAIYAGTVFNLGAIFGNVLQGYISQIIGLRKAIIAFYVITGILMIAFGYISGNWLILITFGLIGFGSQGGLIGLYAVGARLYPTEVRNTGIGWAIGAGRTGAIISPTIGGTLVNAGLSLASSFLIFVAPLALACVAISLIRTEEID
ncbi:MAG: major facilitator superfamily MFS 1 [Gammaproteobacteria bacterium]|nr:major facilitator superfamily MFS 1 [Gammaproteobacteria bacterium]